MGDAIAALGSFTSSELLVDYRSAYSANDLSQLGVSDIILDFTLDVVPG
jgi:hypothetical protein